MEVRSTQTVTGVWILDEETDHALEKLTQVDGMRIPTRIAHHLASRLRGLHLVSLQDHPDRIQPIGKGDEIIRDAKTRTSSSWV